MNSLITKISQAIKDRRPKRQMAVHMGIALSFVAIALGYLVANSVSVTQAFTIILPPIPPQMGAIHLTSPIPGQSSNPAIPPLSKRLLANQTVTISWSLDAADYTDYTVDMYYRQMSGTGSYELVQIDTAPAESYNGSRKNSYEWTIPVEAASFVSEPNPYDRQVYIRLIHAKYPVGWDTSPDFLILHVDTNEPRTGSLVYGSEINVRWATHLSGAQASNATMRLVRYNAGAYTGTNLTARAGVNLTNGTTTWKVGYHWDSSLNRWVAYGGAQDWVGKTVRVWLNPNIPNQTISGYYHGYDDDADLTDDWLPAVPIVAQQTTRVDLTPTSANLTAGQTQQFTAKAYDQSSNLITDKAADFTWAVTGADGNHNMITPGLFDITTAGTYTVTATYGGKSDSSTVTVTPGIMQTVEITYVLPAGGGVVDGVGDPIKVKPNTEIPFTGVAYDQYRNVVDNDPAKFAWSATRTPNDPAQSIFKQTAVGIYPVRAIYNSNYLSNIVNIEVVGGGASRIIIWPSAPAGGFFEDRGNLTYSVMAGVDIQFNLQVQDSEGNILMNDESNPDIVWTNIDKPNGVFYKTVANMTDGYNVTATYGGITSDPVTMLVSPGIIQRVTLDPALLQMPLPVGHSLSFTATAWDTWNNTWVSSNNPERFNWGWRLQGETSYHNDLSHPNPYVFTPSAVGTYEVIGVYVGGNNTVLATPTIVPVSATALSAKYLSRIFDLDAGEAQALPIGSLGTFVSNFDAPAGSQISFFMKFYNAAGNLLGTGEYPLNVAESGVGVDMDSLFKTEYAWFSQINQVQIIFVMSTTDYLETQPSITDLQFTYFLNAPEVGTLNFVTVNRKSVDQGQTIDFDLVAMPMEGLGTDTVSVELGLDWNGDAAGTGAQPAGITPSFVQNGSTNNVIAGFTYSADSTGYPFKLSITSSATVTDTYNFSVTGTVVGDSTRTLAPALGILDVNGGIVTTGDFSLEFVGEHIRSVRPGNTATYQILVKSINSFSGSVALSTDIITGHKFATGAIASATFDRESVTPTPEGNSVILSIGTSSTAAEEGPTTFTITGDATGTAGNIIHNITPDPSLQIDNQAPEQPSITVHATIPTETAKGTDQPQFVFRLYPYSASTRAGYTYQQTGILPSVFSGDIVDIVVPDGLVSDGSRYVGYAKSTRHLWKKSSTDFTVNASGTSQIYNLTFPQLVAGNVGPTPDAGAQFLNDDQINSLDWLTWLQEAAGIWTTKIADFDNNNSVNTADLSWILGDLGAHWGLSGDLFTNLPN